MGPILFQCPGTMFVEVLAEMNPVSILRVRGLREGKHVFGCQAWHFQPRGDMPSLLPQHGRIKLISKVIGLENKSRTKTCFFFSSPHLPIHSIQ